MKEQQANPVICEIVLQMKADGTVDFKVGGQVPKPMVIGLLQHAVVTMCKDEQ